MQLWPRSFGCLLERQTHTSATTMEVNLAWLGCRRFNVSRHARWPWQLEEQPRGQSRGDVVKCRSA